MPALVLFGKRTLVAGDDLQISSVLALLLRATQIVLITIVGYYLNAFHETHKDDPCRKEIQVFQTKGTVLVIVYFGLSLLLVIVATILEVLILHTSKQGRPTEPERRVFLKSLCFVKIIPLSIIRVTTLVFGCMCGIVLNRFCDCLLEQDVQEGADLLAPKECGPHASGLLQSLRVLLGSHFLEVSFAIFLYLYFIFGKLRPKRRSSAQQGWKLVCRVCCTCTSVLTCCLLGGTRAIFTDFMDVSTALDQFFDGGGHLDVTLSDIVLGLYLVYQEQSQERERCRHQLLADDSETSTTKHTEPSTKPTLRTDSTECRQSVRQLQLQRDNRSTRVINQTTRQILDRQHSSDRECILDGAHYSRVADAIYGYMMYLVHHGIKGSFRLSKSYVSGRLCEKGDDKASVPASRVYGDTLLGCNKAAFLLVAGLTEEDLLYGSFHSTLQKRPYSIAVDREKKAIVLVIRGTFSLEDAVADLTIRPEPLEEVGQRCGFDGTGHHCHAGMLASAEWLYKDLDSHGTLNDIFGNKDGSFNCTGYKLVVTGHSLGAGVAAILSLMLRSRFPDHKCFCYEPPGCIFSPGIAKQDNVVSFVLGSDIVPRLSLQSLENLRNDVLEMILRTKVPKKDVFSKFRRAATRASGSSLTFSREETPSCQFRDQLNAFKSFEQARKAELGEDVTLVTPGQIIHLVKTAEDIPKRFWSRSGDPHQVPRKYTPVWACYDDFTEIQLSDSFASDHDCCNLVDELEELAEDYLENET